MELSLESFEICKAMAEKGNPNSASDAGVGALCARAAVHGAWLNVRINVGDIEDKAWVEEILAKAKAIATQADILEKEVMELVGKHVA